MAPGLTQIAMEPTRRSPSDAAKALSASLGSPRMATRAGSFESGSAPLSSSTISVFRGEVAGVRQTYFVLEAQGSYFVLSFARSELKPGAGYFNVVDSKAVDYVRARFAGEKVVTAQEVTARARRTKHAPTSLVALNILYVLVALDEAKIVSEGQHRQLRFSIARRSK
jgi:hypothetical protein